MQEKKVAVVTGAARGMGFAAGFGRYPDVP